MDILLGYLKKLDLSEVEARLYLALLENGPKRVKELADIVGLKRTTAYLHIDSLVEKGLVAGVIKGSNKQISATQPESLKYLVEKKLQTAEELKKTFPSILRSIDSIKPDKKETEETEIKYFKGINSVKAIYEEAFKGHEIRSYVKVEETPALSSDNATLFHEAFIKNKKLKMWEIVYESPFSRRQAMKILSHNKSYFYKFMPKDMKWSITSEDIVSYDGKVAIINYSGKVSIVVLHSPDFYNNFKEIFDFIWRMLPESNS